MFQAGVIGIPDERAGEATDFLFLLFLLLLLCPPKHLIVIVIVVGILPSGRFLKLSCSSTLM